MRFFLLITIFFSSAVNSYAQDPHFSQFFSSPLTLNPAFIGKFDGTVRVAGNYRNQWPTIDKAYETETVSVDFSILQKKLATTDTWGIGIMAYSDKSANGAVNFNYASLGTAFHKGLDENGYKQLGAGFQATYANMMINTANLKFEDQLTPFGFTGVTSEIFNNSTLKNHYFDLNAGVLYTASTSNKNNFYAGVSAYHINRPQQQFTGGLYLLNPRFTFHAGGFFPVGDITTLHLSGLFSTQAKAHETVVGGAFQFALGDQDADKPMSFYAGSWIRLSDAIIPYIGLEFSDFRLGVTYDINTSQLKTASQSQGGIEVSLIYIKKPAQSKGIPCPKF
ncbi:MAG: PorP/SprF family type IX secretion system membrane protein [Chitinophagaceae bacterium]